MGLFFGSIGYAIIKWKSEVRIDAAAKTVVFSSGWAMAKPTRQYSLSAFEAIEHFSTRYSPNGLLLSGGWKDGSAQCFLQDFDSKALRDAEAKALSELIGLPVRDPYNPGSSLP